jgi:hypothetical protein
MEALAGQTLEQAMRAQGRFAPGRVLDIAWQLLHTLQALHREDVNGLLIKKPDLRLGFGEALSYLSPHRGASATSLRRNRRFP